MGSEIDRGIAQRLRKLIGRRCTYLGKTCRVIEVLSDGGILVLASSEPLPPIQVDQYGQATSRFNELLQIPIFGDDESSYSDEIMDLLAGLDGDSEGAAPSAV